MLTGSLRFLDKYYPVIVTSFTKNSLIYIVLSETPFNDEYGVARTEGYYMRGGRVEQDYVIGMLNVSSATSYGSVVLIESILKTISAHKTKSILSSNVKVTVWSEVYEDGENYVEMRNNQMVDVNIDNGNLQLKLTENPYLNIPVRTFSKLLTHDYSVTHVAQTTFVDATMELLELRGFDFSWMKNKRYIPIQSVEDFENILIPDFISQLKLHLEKVERGEQDWESFLTVMDFEATGLEAWCDKADFVDEAVYLGISFQDHVAYGIFFNMKNFQNVEDIDRIANHLTNMFQIDPVNDRTIELTDKDGSKFTYKRSQIKTSAHHMLIDIRFGLRLGIDIWFDYCSMQIGFNADPFFARGNNGAKSRIEQFFEISYPELSDICGKGHEGRFAWLSDIRVVMMYGCADVDLVRLYTKELITGIRDCTEYYGVDQIEQFEAVDKLYMNFKARFDYKGVRVDVAAANKKYVEMTDTLNQYHEFMRHYIGRVLKFKKFYDLYVSLVSAGKDVSALEIPDLNEAPPVTADKWSGNFLLDILFKVCQYPKLVMTKPSRQVLLSGKKFVPKPAVDKEAVKYYLKWKSLKTPQEIEAAIKKSATLEDLKIASMYLESDVINSRTGEVLISKDIFNSFRYPFFYILQSIGPIESSIQSDLEPLVNLKSGYRFAGSSMSSVVTRRDVSTMCTVSKDAKYFYKGYTPDHNIVDADQATVEIRIAWGLSGDRRLIDPLNDPEKDPHTEACSEFFNKPAYLVDKKKERKPVKFINFGRIYGREVYSCCNQIFDGDMSPENLASTAYMVRLFDEKRKPVLDHLDVVRDDMWTPREIPPFLFKFFKLKEDKQYGRMKNIFNWTQHCEIRDDDDYYKAMMRRKAGNFAVQGAASHILRILWVRVVLNFWKKGWIQDESVIPHLTIYDEIMASYKKTLNPIEVAVEIRNAFLVQYKDFPKLFIGLNFGHSWGQTKEDDSELPTYLVERFKREYSKGMHREPIAEDHYTYLGNLKREYTTGRISEVLLELNKKQSAVWWVEQLSKDFNNYTVRGMLFEHNKGVFKIKDYNDPIESLLSVLAFFVSKEMLRDNDTATFMCRNKKISITSETWQKKYADESSFLAGNHLQEKVQENDFSALIDSNEVDDPSELYYDFGFDDDAGGDEYRFTAPRTFEADNVESWDSSFMKAYFVPEGNLKDGKLLSLEEYFRASKTTNLSFKNFTVRGNSVIIQCTSLADCQKIVLFCRNKQTTSTDCFKIFAAFRGAYTKSAGSVKLDVLKELDEWISTEIKTLHGVV